MGFVAPAPLLFSFFFFVVIYQGLELFVFTSVPDPVSESTSGRFSGMRAYQHWFELADATPHRYMSTENYNKSYDYILNMFKAYAEEKRENVVVKIEEQIGQINENRLTEIMQYQTDVRNILVTIGTTDNIENPPLVISAHLDSKNTGPGAWDDCAGIVGMIELGQTLIEADSLPRTPVMLLFIGTEELGLQGSTLFLESNKTIAAYLNVEGLGAGPPLVFAQKGKRSSNVANAWRKTRRSIMATFGDDVLKAGLMDTLSDASRFNQAGLSGGEALFIGNPSSYHTKNDRIGSPGELQLLGDQLINLVYNFDASKEDVDVISVGIWPIVIVIPMTWASTISIMAAVSFVSCLIFGGIKYSAVLKCLKAHFMAFLGTLAIGLVLTVCCYWMNPHSYVMQYSKTLLIVGTICISLYANILSRASVDPDASQWCIVLFSMVMSAVLRGFDFSMLPIWQMIFSGLALLFLHKYPVLSLIMNLAGSYTFTVVWCLLYRTALKYSVSVPGFAGEMIVIMLCVVLVVKMVWIMNPFVLSKMKRFNRASIIITICCVIFVIVKPTEFNKEFSCPVIAHHIMEENDSFISIVPEGGDRILRFLDGKTLVKSGIRLERGVRHPMSDYDCLIKHYRPSLPSFISRWPEFNLSVNSIGNNQRTVSVDVIGHNPHLHRTTLVVSCENRSECVRRVDGFEKLTSMIVGNERRYAIRHCPAFYDHHFSFELDSPEKARLDITFAYDEFKTPEVSDFFASLPDYVVTFSKTDMIGDVLLVNHTFV